MKKKYEKPFVYMEQFAANQFVATNCNVSITQLNSTSTMNCMRSDLFAGHTTNHNKSKQVFMNADLGCLVIIKSGVRQTELQTGLFDSKSVIDGGYVYGFSKRNGTSNGEMMRFIKVDGAYYYTDDLGNSTGEKIGNDDCFGWFQTNASTSSYINPYS